MIKKYYKIIYWVFIVESILLLLGINLGIVDYGIDLQTPFMAIGIIVGIIISSIVYFVLMKTGRKQIDGLYILFSIVMICLCFYYLLEDKFTLVL